MSRVGELVNRIIHPGRGLRRRLESISEEGVDEPLSIGDQAKLFALRNGPFGTYIPIFTKKSITFDVEPRRGMDSTKPPTS